MITTKIYKVFEPNKRTTLHDPLQRVYMTLHSCNHNECNIVTILKSKYEDRFKGSNAKVFLLKNKYRVSKAM